MDKNSLPNVDSLPILVDKIVLANIKGEEYKPYEIVEAIPSPVKGIGGIYTDELLENLKNFNSRVREECDL